jgi:hypothetical protein
MFLSGIGFVYKTRRGTDPILEMERALGDIIVANYTIAIYLVHAVHSAVSNIKQLVTLSS